MRLSRRDALAALAGIGAVGGGAGIVELAARGPPVAGDDAGTVDATPDGPASAGLDEDARAVLVATAEVLYPSAVTGHEAFVDTYVNGRVRGDPDHRAGLLSAVAELDAIARDWHSDAYPELARETRDRLLRDLGVDVADPNPEGPISSRLRWYVVNDLLYAFYTSPTGGRLVGTENPTGYPGGTESYQRGPEALDDG
ncbi:gluconate 2-dehydrogenase subunit 3 family protein [Salinigranum marinum]|uniref:gluconate 2-dehydrogenase subunit 3 family protein n=1 Tax=Salinigranum marinum TaxID=1515595 RepID=UPI002989CFA9|nr:gluconate 2-dehydrogenase subunit 3 family protein [Salinigranum marinum]